MGKEQRDCSLYITLLVYKMYIQRFEAVNLYGGLEIWQRIELSFLLPPIKAFLPVCSQAFHVSQRSAMIPAGTAELVWEDRGFEFGGKSLALFLGNGNGVRLN